jgi:osmotically-inducible protein OsmY
MKNLNEQLKDKDNANIPAKNNVQETGYTNEGNPNTQEDVLKTKGKDTENQPETMASDQQSAQVVKQAIKDDQALAPVANHIHVTVKDGDITLDGKVSTEQQMNLASNTAKAVGVVDEVKNDLEVIH